MSYQYSLNNLRTNSPYYSLNNLNTENGIKSIVGTLPVQATTVGSETTISLYESAPDVIDFTPKSLIVNGFTASSGTFSNILSTGTIRATTGTFTSIYSTGAMFFSLNATGATVNTITATSGFTGGYITASSGTFNFVNANTLTANTINITSLNIPNLQFTIATGGYITSTGTITSRQSLRTTNGNINTFDFTDISSDGDTSIYNAGGALQTSFRFDGNERMKLSSAGKLDVSFLQSSGAFTGASVATTGIIKSGGVLSTTSGRIANGNSAWTTNLNDVFINANNDTIYFRPKGETATPADAQVYLLTNGSLVCTTGTLTAENIYSNRGANFPNAYVSVYGIDSAYQINSPYFTGTKADFTNANITNLTGANIRGNFNGNVSVANPDKMYFYQLDKTTECMRIEPAFGTNVLSWYSAPYGSQIQFFQQATSSGGYFSCNQVALTDYLFSPTIQANNYQPTTTTGLQTNQLIFRNNTSNQSRPFIFCNTGQSSYIQALGVNSRNNGFSIRDTAERWFIYNQANTSTLAINNNSSDLITLTSALMNITPEVKVQNAFNVGAPNFGSNALINLGYTGVLGTTLNTRMGYIYHDASNLVLNNQQYNNPPLLQNSTIGSVYISPANGVYPTIFRPSGQFVNYNRVDADAGAVFNCYTTGAGYGLYVNKPNDGVNGNNYYGLVLQGLNYTSAITMHPQVSNIMSNITLGRTNYPFSNDALTIRPYSTSSQDTFMLIANDYQERNGKVYIGQNGTGGFRPSDFFIQNWSNNLNGKKSGIYFQTDTGNYGVGCNAQYIDYTGQTFFNPYTNRSVDTPTNSQTGSTFSVVYGFKSLPQVGTVYTTSRGAGKYIPWVKATANNANYTVAGGLQKIALADATSVNASPWQTPAGARQYSFRCDFQGLYDVRWNLNIFALATTAYYVYVYKNGAMVSTSIGDVSRAGTFSFCNGATLVQCNAGDDIDMRILPDTQTITVGNESTIQAMYVG